MCGSIIARGSVATNVVQVLNGIVGLQFLGSDHPSSNGGAPEKTCSLWECLCIARGLTAFNKIELQYLQTFAGAVVLLFLYVIARMLRGRNRAGDARRQKPSAYLQDVLHDSDDNDDDDLNAQLSDKHDQLSDALLASDDPTPKLSRCSRVIRAFSGTPDQFAGAFAQWMLLAYTSFMKTTAAMITCSNTTPAFLFYDGSWECGFWQVGGSRCYFVFTICGS
jgi:hypothetical protein